MIAATNALIDGHGLLADWLLLVAAVLFVVAAVLARRPTTAIAASEVGYAGLAVAACALLVL